jgi:DNA repair protein RecN (Recombination protein N)
MVLTALGLLLGSRSDSTAIRQGQDQAFVEGRWYLPNSHTVTEEVTRLGGRVDEGELLINRSVTKDGRSRAVVGGASAPVGSLAELGELLVVVHGQADQIRLKSATAQRDALDKFAGISELLNSYQAKYSEYRALETRLEQLRAASSERDSELAALKLAFEELEQLKPLPGEDVQLTELANRLTHSEELRLAAAGAHEFLSTESYDDSADAITLVGKARKLLESAGTHDPELAGLAEKLSELGYELGSVAASLSGYLDSVESEGELRLEQVHERRASLNSAIRKYGPTLNDVIEYWQSASTRIMDLDNSDEQLETLAHQLSTLKTECLQLAKDISVRRQNAALLLESEVTAELSTLAMGGATLVVAVNASEELQLHGLDAVSIQLAAYPGAEPRPLGKGASGGELSRIMLAIEVVLAKTEQALTFIFDEVDAGVGGASATEVGLRLAQLAKKSQVIVVTHLGQVAAFADRHLRVLKTVGDDFTASDVTLLEGDERISELARMISGLADSEGALANARELVERAKQAIG